MDTAVIRERMEIDRRIAVEYTGLGRGALFRLDVGALWR